MATELGGYYKHSIEIEFNDGDKWKQANAILSRLPLSQTTSDWINKPRGGASSGSYDDEIRGLISARTTIEDKELRIATTHMSYTHKFEPTDRKHEETDKLIELLSGLSDNVIFTGDLNATPDSYTVRQIESILQNAGPEYDQNTWDTKPFSYQGFEADSLDWRLDYVFTSPRIQVLSSQIVQTDVSDHLPILVEVEI